MAKKQVNLTRTPTPSAQEIVRASMDDTPAGAEASADKSRGVAYQTKEGVPKVRVSLHLTKAQRRRLNDAAEDAGLSVSDYVARQLGL